MATRIDLKTKFTLDKRLVETNRRIEELMGLVENDPSPILDKVLKIELAERDKILKELSETNYPKETEMKNIKIPTSLEIMKKLDNKVFGHEEAKKILINIARRAMLRASETDMEELPPMNCLLVGASGTGKTYLMECLQDICDFPLIKIDATQLTHTSASGINQENVIKMIQDKATGLSNDLYKNFGIIMPAKKIMRSIIVFVDEIDKLAKEGNPNGNWDKKTQANFLTLFGNQNDDMKHISWIFAGAFSSMDEENKPLTNRKPLGFTAKKEDNESKNVDLDEKIIKYGLMPELVGRMQHIVSLDILTKANYKEILETIVLPKKNAELALFNIMLDPTPEEKEALINKAFKSGLGVRGMKSHVERLAVDLEFNFSEDTYKELNKFEEE